MKDIQDLLEQVVLEESHQEESTQDIPIEEEVKGNTVVRYDGTIPSSYITDEAGTWKITGSSDFVTYPLTTEESFPAYTHKEEFDKEIKNLKEQIAFLVTKIDSLESELIIQTLKRDEKS